MMYVRMDPLSIVGSHESKFSLWNVIKQRDTLSDKPLLGCIDAGDTILYDARIFHRGRGSLSLVLDLPPHQIITTRESSVTALAMDWMAFLHFLHVK